MKSLDWLRSRIAADRAYWRATMIYASDVRASLLRDEPLDFAIAQARTYYKQATKGILCESK